MTSQKIVRPDPWCKICCGSGKAGWGTTDSVCACVLKQIHGLRPDQYRVDTSWFKHWTVALSRKTKCAVGCWPGHTPMFSEKFYIQVFITGSATDHDARWKAEMWDAQLYRT